MKTRRALQIIVGILSLLVVAALVVATAGYVFLMYAREDLFETQITIAGTIYQGLCAVGLTVGLTEDLVILVPALAYGLPCALLLLAAILMFLPKTDKQARYVAANILSLVGATVFAVFNIVFAPDILGGSPAVSYRPEVVQAMIDSALYVRIAFGGLLALFVLFVGLSLGLKPKREKATTEDTAATVESETATEEAVTAETTVEEPEQPTVEAEQTSETATFETETTEQAPTQAPAKETPATEYVPNTDVTVNDIVENTYGGNIENLSADTVAKINKLRALLDSNAISQAEYLKLVNIYLGKR